MSTGGQGGGGQGGGAGAGAGEGAATGLPWAGDAATPYNIGDKAWYEHMPDGPAKALLADKKYANPTVLANSYYELNRAASARNPDNSVVIPGDGATDADREAFYTKLGRPPDPTGYKDTVVWGDNPDERMQGFASDLGFKLGLSPKQLSTLVGEWNKFAGGLETEQAAAAEAGTAEITASLKADMGADYEKNLTAGNRVLTALKNNGLSEADFTAIEQHVGAGPVIKLLATIGKLTGEASFMASAGGALSDPANMSPEQAAGEIKRLQADPEFQKAYTGAQHPQHKESVDRMANLFVKAGDKFQV